MYHCFLPAEVLLFSLCNVCLPFPPPFDADVGVVYQDRFGRLWRCTVAVSVLLLPNHSGVDTSCQCLLWVLTQTLEQPATIFIPLPTVSQLLLGRGFPPTVMSCGMALKAQ